jgi:hypothetical protein
MSIRFADGWNALLETSEFAGSVKPRWTAIMPPSPTAYPVIRALAPSSRKLPAASEIAVFEFAATRARRALGPVCICDMGALGSRRLAACWAESEAANTNETPTARLDVKPFLTTVELLKQTIKT